MRNSAAGQSLIEAVIALGIGALVIGAATFAIAGTLGSNTSVERTRQASFAAQQLLDRVRAVSDARWNDIYALPDKLPSAQYTVAPSGTMLAVMSGVATTTAGGVIYEAFFSIEDVCRSAVGVITRLAPCGGVTEYEDTATQFITAHVTWGAGSTAKEVAVSSYLTQWKNRIVEQAGFDGGSGFEGPVSSTIRGYATSTNIDITPVGSLQIRGL